ncbi:MAG: hypothetical protein ACYTG6_02345 [Planctomycetota bacterium]|jgi:hypothetical protein
MGTSVDPQGHFGPLGFEPDAAQVEDLIQRAEKHELGTAFLAKGAQDAVAATFQVHAFVVDAARARLQAMEEAIRSHRK